MSGLTDEGTRTGQATMLTATTAILEAARRQIERDFDPSSQWVGEARHHIDKAVSVIESNVDHGQDAAF